MYIAVDFDGTIVDHKFPDIGEPVPGAIYWMKRWHDLGAKIILYTMRSDGPKANDVENTTRNVLLDAVRYLKDNGVELFGINENPDQASWSLSRKVYAHIYVDDAAYGCPLIQVKGFERMCVDWNKVGASIEYILSNKK